MRFWYHTRVLLKLIYPEHVCGHKHAIALEDSYVTYTNNRYGQMRTIECGLAYCIE